MLFRSFELSGDMKCTDSTVGRSFRDGLYGGGAGCTALHAAILLGGDPIYLLGYDYYEQNGRHFDAYDETRNDAHIYDVSFEGIEHISRQDWIPRVYCCNPRSRVRCFPFLEIDAVLTGRSQSATEIGLADRFVD